MYKLIATDMDGTLLQSDQSIGDKNIQAIIDFQKNNGVFVLASGRPLGAMTTYQDMLHMSEFSGYIMAYNGAMIYECKTSKIIYSNGLNIEQAKYIIDMAKEYGVTYVTYMDNTIYTNEINNYTKIEADYVNMNIIKVDGIEDLDINKVMKFMFIAEPERIKEISKDFDEKAKKYNLNLAISDPHFLEITDISVNKGLALKNLCSILNIDLKDTIACGDSYNDQAMLEIAGLSVAAANAKDDIKKICKYISVHHNENIIYDVIKTHF